MNVTLLQFDYSSSNGIFGDGERQEKLSIVAKKCYKLKLFAVLVSTEQQA